jgi:hypothetical protein
MNTRLFLIGLVGMVALGCPCGANGQDEVYGFPYVWSGWGYGWLSCSTDTAPYFALHPPVYYSYHVARTYGYSPFAYPPDVLTPGSEPPRSTIAQNAYPPGPGETSEAQQGRLPLRIENPFVEQPRKPGVAKDQKPAVRRPQVVYPAALARRTG